MVVAQIDGVEGIACDGEVFYGGDGEGTEDYFSFSQRVGPLFGGVEDVGREAHVFMEEEEGGVHVM